MPSAPTRSAASTAPPTAARRGSSVLFKDKDTGASDVCFDPTNPRILFAGLWQARRRPWELTSGGPGSGLYVSRDGGDTWTQLVAPPKPDSPDAGKEPPQGQEILRRLAGGHLGQGRRRRRSIDGQRVYALIEAEKGGLFRSDDGGDTWDAHQRRPRPAAAGLVLLHASPSIRRTPTSIYFPQVPLLKSIDGGKTLQRVKGPHHGDHHDIWIDPKNPNRMIDSNDGGVDITHQRRRDVVRAAAADRAVLSRQRPTTARRITSAAACRTSAPRQGPSNSLLGGRHPLSATGIPSAAARPASPSPIPTDPNIVYAGEYGGYISRYDHRTRQATQHRHLSLQPVRPRRRGPATIAFSGPPRSLISPHDRKVIYHAANVLFKIDRRRPDLEGDQRRPDAQRQEQAEMVRRPDHRRQHRRRGLLHHLRHRRIAEAKGPALGRQRRRPGPRHARRRQDLDQRHAEHQGPAGMGHGLLHRAVAASTRTRPMSSWTLTGWTT